MQQESQGHLEAKVKKQRASPSSVLRVFFFFHLLTDFGARAALKITKL